MAGVAAMVGCLLAAAVPLQSGTAMADTTCYGRWTLTTGTDSGAGGHQIWWVTLSSPNIAPINGEFKTGTWSGSEIQNGATGHSGWRTGSCEKARDAGYNSFSVAYDQEFADQWEMVGARLDVSTTPGDSGIFKSYFWSGSTWLHDDDVFTYKWARILQAS
ncbi:hypothetical protein ABTX81_32830 [Kitasatospora sp. NPDC097605]|uniref:hypothetical protein n=1 Tax=Kitasatospora sp. NPDC097605 TaxID=3157226 RepID=UPI00332B9DB5